MANRLLTREEWMKSLDKLIDETATQSLIDDAISDEREACANLRKDIPLIGAHSAEYEEGFWDGLAAYEAAIRERNEK